MKQLTDFQQEIMNEVGSNPSYNEFYKAYLELFRLKHPNSAAPSNNMISSFYDDYIKIGEIIPY